MRVNYGISHFPRPKWGPRGSFLAARSLPYPRKGISDVLGPSDIFMKEAMEPNIRYLMPCGKRHQQDYETDTVGDSSDKLLRGASFLVDCYGRQGSINTGWGPIGRPMKAINAIGRNMPVGHLHAPQYPMPKCQTAGNHKAICPIAISLIAAYSHIYITA